MTHSVVLTPATSPRWAAARDRLGPHAPERLALLGDPALLEREQVLAFFCSQRAPASILLQAHDLARGWRSAGPVLVSGFQSLVEREVQTVLLGGTRPLVLVRGRPLPARWRPSREQRAAWDEGRLLVVAPEQGGGWGRSASLARNRLAAALANALLIAHATPDGATVALAQEALVRSQPVYTLAGSWNKHLLALGVAAWGEGENYG